MFSLKNCINSLDQSLTTFIFPSNWTKSFPSAFKLEINAFELESNPNPAIPNSVWHFSDISANFAKVKSFKSSTVYPNCSNKVLLTYKTSVDLVIGSPYILFSPHCDNSLIKSGIKSFFKSSAIPTVSFSTYGVKSTTLLSLIRPVAASG